MKIFEVIVSVCLLALVLAASMSLLNIISDTSMKTMFLRHEVFLERQRQIEVDEMIVPEEWMSGGGL